MWKPIIIEDSTYTYASEEKKKMKLLYKETTNKNA